MGISGLTGGIKVRVGMNYKSEGGNGRTEDEDEDEEYDREQSCISDSDWTPRTGGPRQR